MALKNRGTWGLALTGGSPPTPWEHPAVLVYVRDRHARAEEEVAARARSPEAGGLARSRCASASAPRPLPCSRQQDAPAPPLPTGPMPCHQPPPCLPPLPRDFASAAHEVGVGEVAHEFLCALRRQEAALGGVDPITRGLTGTCHALLCSRNAGQTATGGDRHCRMRLTTSPPACAWLGQPRHALGMPVCASFTTAGRRPL